MWNKTSKERHGFPKATLEPLCPKCKSDLIFYADNGTPNDDCFQCGGCNHLGENKTLIIN